MPTRSDLEVHFRDVGDDELLERARSGDLTALAQGVADEELRRRGLWGSASLGHATQEQFSEQDWVAVTGPMYQQEADVVTDLLGEEDIPVKQASPNKQGYRIFAPELDTVQVLVPRDYLERARSFLEAKEKEAEGK